MTVVNNKLLAIVADLAFCPICGNKLEIDFEVHHVVEKKCPNHGKVFTIALAKHHSGCDVDIHIEPGE